MTGNPSPFDFTEARAAARSASEAQAATENAIREAVQKRAAAERDYRRALARRILSAHDEGVAWSVASDIARGDEEVSELRHKRDVAEGICEALSQAGWRHSADRKDLTRLIAWSERVAPDGQHEAGRLRGAA